MTDTGTVGWDEVADAIGDFEAAVEAAVRRVSPTLDTERWAARKELYNTIRLFAAEPATRGAEAQEELETLKPQGTVRMNVVKGTLPTLDEEHEHRCNKGLDAIDDHDVCTCNCGATSWNTMGEAEWTEGTTVPTGRRDAKCEHGTSVALHCYECSGDPR